jgi:hypothetical protein
MIPEGFWKPFGSELTTMSKEAHKSWERFLNPTILRTNLIAASMYIAAFEFLKESIVERIRNFLVWNLDETGIQADLKYRTDVLSKNRSPVYASLEWLKEIGAVEDHDIALFDQAKECRNSIAHEMNRMLSDGLPPDWQDRFNDMVYLLDKIEKWWIVNVEIPANPVFDGKVIDESEIIPGPVAGLGMMLDIALGPEELSRFYFDEFKNNLQTPEQ